MARIEVKLSDLLRGLYATRTRRKTSGAINEQELQAICDYLKTSQASRRDLEFELSMGEGAVLRRLDALIEMGIVEHLPGHLYGLRGETPCTQ